jgi:uncharacterized protein YoxC
MTEAAGWVLVALAAVLVGAAIPVLVQLRRTLKTTQDTLEMTGRHANDALARLTETLERVNRAADGLEHGVSKVSSLLEVLGGLGDALSKVRSTVGAAASMGSIVGSALLAAFGLRSRGTGREPEPEPAEAVVHEEKTR